MKAADITQLRYLFDMYYRVFYNKNIIEKKSIFLFLSSVGKNTELRIQPKKLKLSTVNRKVLEITTKYECNKTTRGNAKRQEDYVTKGEKARNEVSTYEYNFIAATCSFCLHKTGL